MFEKLTPEQEAFKPYKKGVLFNLFDKINFGWFFDKKTKLPTDKIFIGISGANYPLFTLTPYDIKEVTCEKPGFFKKGILNVIGANGNRITSIEFKDKSNMKTAETFNQMLALYKKLNFGKKE